MKILSVGAELFRENERTDMTKLIIAFRNFVNAPVIARDNTCTEWSRLFVICSADAVAPFTLNTY